MSERPKDGVDPDATVMQSRNESPAPDPDATVMVPAHRPDDDATVFMPSQAADDDDASFSAGLARYQLGIDVPIFRCLGQFTLYILSLRKQTLCTRFQKRVRQRQQLV